MAGIYIHIPFCKQRCYYCDFHFTTSLQNEERIISAIQKEIITRKNEINEPIKSIYIGGGTPSILKEGKIEGLIETIYKHYQVVEKPEITLEANPDDLELKKVIEYKNSGINRFSIGIQSFHQKDLEFMNRAHNSLQAEKCIPLVQDAGFDNITIDLIYGIPTQSDIEWNKNIDKFLSLNVKHLSAYALTVEEKTPLNKLISSGKYPNVSDEKSFNDFKQLISRIESSGFEQYEISNFCKDENYSIHNSSYWKGDKYLGFGPSAHSYDSKNRRWNLSSNKLYLEGIDNNSYFEEELLSNSDKFNELLLTGLRTKWGVNLKELENSIDVKSFSEFTNNLKSLINSKKVIIVDDKLLINKEYKFQSDGITSELFII